MWLGRSKVGGYELAVVNDWDGDDIGFSAWSTYRGETIDNVLSGFCVTEFHKRTNIKLEIGERRRVKSINIELHPKAKK